MMRKIVVFSILILIAVACFYPVQRYTFSQLYQKDDDVHQSLKNFRALRTKTITCVNHSVMYLTEGSGDTCILFLHGMGGSYDIWWQQISHFKEKYRTISLTYPKIDNLKELSKCVISILDEEKIQKVVIVGSSLGGYLAQYIATFHYDRVLMVSLGNTFPPNTEIKSKNENLMRVMQYLPEWLVVRSIRSKYNDEVVPAAENSEIVRAFLNELLGNQVKKEDFINRYYCVVDHFIPEINKSIPMQIIESDNDPLVSKGLRDLLKSTYPQATFVTLKHKGHFPYLNDADEYNKLIESFLLSLNKVENL